MSELHDVYLDEFAYPCVAYCIKRKGLKIGVEQLRKMKKQAYMFLSHPLQQGDICIWMDDRQGHENGTLIINDGIPITMPVHYGEHWGIYEGNGKYSDCVFLNDTYFPTIRVRRYEDVPNPSYIITDKDLSNAGYNS